MSERRVGWFVDRGDDGWVPCVQTATLNFSLDVWFRTEEECARFINTELLGLGALREEL